MNPSYGGITPFSLQKDGISKINAVPSYDRSHEYLKAYGSEVNLGYLEPMLVRPTRHQSFGNTLGLVCRLDLANTLKRLISLYTSTFMHL